MYFNLTVILRLFIVFFVLALSVTILLFLSSIQPLFSMILNELQRLCGMYLQSVLLFFQILNVSAIVLANLCVSYIMTSQNEEVSIH